MRQNLFCIVSLCFLIVMMSCGDSKDEPSMNVITEPTDNPEEKVPNSDVGNLERINPEMENVENPDPDEEVEGVDLAHLDAINGVLERLHEGYENEDLDLYLSAFWIEGFQYTSDMGTPADPFDDVTFDELKDEGESAERIFTQFQAIEMELSHPIHIINAAPKRIEAMNHYRIQGFANEGHTLEGGFIGWFAEGDNRLTFEFRQGEWRIAKWLDDAFNAEMVKIANNVVQPELGGKLIATWGSIKIR